MVPDIFVRLIGAGSSIKKRMTMQVISTIQAASDGRAQRSMLARRVSRTLEQFLARRAFLRLDLGKARLGRMTHRILWRDNRVYRFVLDFDAGAVTIPSLLPATLLRELRCFTRAISSDCLRDGAYLDPQKGELRLFAKHGSLTLSVTVRNDAYEYCTEQLIKLADGALESFLEQPAREQKRGSSFMSPAKTLAE